MDDLLFLLSIDHHLDQIDAITTQCKIEFTYQSQKPPILKVFKSGKMVLNTQFHAKISKETLVYFGWYLVNPHDVQAVQNMCGKVYPI